MSLEERSIERQRKREANFLPPYCPNNKCPHHLNPQSGFSFKYGTAALKRFPYVSQRFRCKHCLRTFSASLFTLNFWQKVWGGNELIFMLHGLGVSKRAIARELYLHEKSVRGRQIKMSRWAILQHALRTQDLKVEEPLLYDGLENFSSFRLASSCLGFRQKQKLLSNTPVRQELPHRTPNRRLYPFGWHASRVATADFFIANGLDYATSCEKGVGSEFILRRGQMVTDENIEKCEIETTRVFNSKAECEAQK